MSMTAFSQKPGVKMRSRLTVREHFDSRYHAETDNSAAHYTVGASADSGYEYLLKQWLLSGDAKARDQCK